VVAGGAANEACRGDAGAEAGAVAAVRAGAVLAGSKETGFWAVWHEEPAMAMTASIAIRTWSFATRIFFYEIRLLLGAESPLDSIKIVSSGLARVNAEKEAQQLPSAPDRLVTYGPNTQTAEAGKRFESDQTQSGSEAQSRRTSSHTRQ